MSQARDGNRGGHGRQRARLSRLCHAGAGVLLAGALAGAAACARPVPELCPAPALGLAVMGPVSVGGMTADTAEAGLRLRLNIPAYRLEAFEGDRMVSTFPVAVGMRGYPTPTGNYSVSRVVWNPWWTPPDEPWAAAAKVTPPGPTNPMGRVKLYFSPTYLLHGTPSEASIGKAASHGCVRMRNEDAIALARMVHAHASGDVAPATLDSLAASPRRTRSITLEEPVPLEVVYEMAEVRGDTLSVLPDIYGHGAGVEEVVQILMRGGFGPERIETDSVRALVRRSRTSPVAVPVGAVLSAPGEPGPGAPHAPPERR